MAQSQRHLRSFKKETSWSWAYARHNLTLSDWIPHSNPGRTSNTWRGWSSEGVELHICIGLELMNPPTIMPSRALPYGTVIPKNN